MFDSYSVRGKLNFYKNTDDQEKVTISIGVTANHQVNQNIYEQLSDFLEKLLIDNYINEDQYQSIKYMKSKRRMQLNNKLSI